MNTHKSIIHMRLLLVITALTASSCAKKPPSIKYLNFDPVVESSNEGDDKRTAKSIKKFDGFYTVTYYGNYEERLEWLQDYHVKKASEISRSRSCSLFS